MRPVLANTNLRALVANSSLRIPDYIVPSDWHQHAPFLFWLLDALRPRRFVELGTYRGYSYFVACQAVQELGLGTACYAIDNWHGDERTEVSGEEIFEQVRLHQEARYAGFSQLIRATFDEALRYFPDASIDLLHIDGRHCYEDVHHDFACWQPKLTDTGVVLLHDTNVREREFGIWRLFGELNRDHPTFDFRHGRGLGVIAPGQVPSALTVLFEADETTADFVRAIYAALGSAITERVRRSAAENAREQRTEELRLLRIAKASGGNGVSRPSETVARQEEVTKPGDAIAGRKLELGRLEQDGAGQAQKLNGLEQDGASRGQRLSHLRDTVASQEQEVARLGDAIAIREQELSRLEQNGASQAQQLGGLEQDGASRQQRLSHLRDTVASQEREVARVTDAIAGREQELSRLEQDGTSQEQQLSGLEQDGASRGQRVGRLRDVVASQAQEVARLGDAIANREQELSRLEQDGTGEEQQLSGLEQDGANRGQRLSHLRGTVASQEQEVARLGDVIASREPQLSRLEQDGASGGQRLSHLRDAVASQAREVVRLGDAIASREQELSRLEEDSANRERQLGRLHNIVASQEQEMSRLHDIIASREEDVSRLRDAVANREDEVSRLEQDHASRGQQLSRLHDIVASQDQEMGRLHETIASHEQDASRLREAVANREDEVSRLEQDHAGREKQVSRLHNIAASQEQEVSRLHETVANQEQEMSRLREAVASRVQEVSGLEVAIASREQEANRLRAVVADRQREVTRLNDVVANGNPEETSPTTVVASGGQDGAPEQQVIASRGQGVSPLTGDASGPGRNSVAVQRASSEPLAEAVQANGSGPPTPAHFDHRAQRSGWWSVTRHLGERYRGWRESQRHPGSTGGEPASVAAAPSPDQDDPTDSRYRAWLAHNRLTEEAVAALGEALRARDSRIPRISVLMPVYNPPTALLERAIESVRAQIYDKWELCIADDASTDSAVRAALQRSAAHDSRIKLLFRKTHGGASVATNGAAVLATGSFLAFLDQADELAPDALTEMAIAIADNPETDFLYSDDDEIDMSGRRFAPNFKPDWAPVLLLSYMYVRDLVVVRRSLYEDLHGLHIGFEGAENHDFALSLSERTRRVIHVPKVLYHARALHGSSADADRAKPGSFEGGRRAVAEALERRGIAAAVEHPEWASQAGLGIFVPRFPDHGPKVSILIHSGKSWELTRICTESIAKTSYRNYEIVILDDESNDPATVAWLEAQPHRVLRISGASGSGFDFARRDNEAARLVDSEYILLLDSDTEVQSPDWLSQMIGYACLDRVGAVGARILAQNDTTEHAGIIHGYYDGMPGPAFRGAHSADRGYLHYAAAARECAAVAAHCLLTPRRLYLELGGLDAEQFQLAYGAVDYCYRLADAGWRSIYCASAQLRKREGQGGEEVEEPREIANFRRRHREREDPWYSPNLSLEDEHFRVHPYHAPVRAPRPVRVVAVSHSLDHEDRAYSLLELMLGLKRRGIVSPTILAPVDGVLRARYEEATIPVHIVASPIDGVRKAGELERRLEELSRYFTKLGAEVLYGSSLQSFWAIGAADKAGLPTVWSIGESDLPETCFDDLPAPLRERAYQCLANPYRVTFVSHATRLGWSSFETAFNFTVIHDGLDTERLEARLADLDRGSTRQQFGIQPGDVAAVVMGAVSEREGGRDAVDALSHVTPSTLERLRLLIVDERSGPDRTALHETIQNLPEPCRQRIFVHPETSDMAPYYKAADFALFMTCKESDPRRILEAMACGLPLVTTAVSDAREQVREDINGFIYEPGDSRALGIALSRLVLDDPLRRQFADNSRAVFDSLPGYADMLKRYGKIFQEARCSQGRQYRPKAMR